MNWILYILPKKLLSRCIGFLVHLPLPGPLKSAVMGWFANRYRLDMNEAEFAMDHYRSIGDLFVRRLKPGLRPIGSASLVHPADSRLTQSGSLEGGALIQAKGKFYQLSEFLGPIEAAPYKGGQFATYYLCPTDYHRVHSPIAGKVLRVAHIPGKFWPVNDWSTSTIDNLFSINERVVVEIEGPHGRVAVVLVAATNVGQMSLAFWPEFRGLSKWKNAPWVRDYSKENLRIEKGAELGAFHMGSTVVLCLSPEAVPKGWEESLPKGGAVLVNASFDERKS